MCLNIYSNKHAGIITWDTKKNYNLSSDLKLQDYLAKKNEKLIFFKYIRKIKHFRSIIIKKLQAVFEI